jgi:hypothetical protein
MSQQTGQRICEINIQPGGQDSLIFLRGGPQMWRSTGHAQSKRSTTEEVQTRTLNIYLPAREGTSSALQDPIALRKEPYEFRQ